MQVLSEISIPIPCHEDWNKMSATEQGRFCNTCSKTVVDFSGMSNEEIIHYLNKHTGSLCGRFENTQLKPPRTISKKLKVFLYALFSVFLVQVSEGAFAQTISDTIIQNKDELCTIYGRITDEKGQGLEYATVMILQDGVIKGRAKTDFNGYYTIYPLLKGSYNLKVSYIGMETEEMNEIPLSSKRKVDLQMRKSNKRVMGGIMFRTVTMPFFDPSNPGQQIMRKEDMKHMPVR